MLVRAEVISAIKLFKMEARLIQQEFGLVALIAKGYRALAIAFLAVYLAPLLTLGVWRLWTAQCAREKPA